MKYLKIMHGLSLPIIAALLLSGCLVSGTFTIEESFSFTASDDLYFYEVDVTDEPDWNDHKDDIDQIDIVGFELWITNNEATAAEFEIYIDEFGETQWTTLGDVQANAVKIFGPLAVAAGPDVTTHVTYGQSMAYIHNVGELKDRAREGRFHYYGVSSGGTDAGYVVDSVKVVITFTAAES